MRGVEHGEAQDVGGVLHDPVQVQDGEVLGPRRGGEGGAGPTSGQMLHREMGASGAAEGTHHGGEDVLVKR